MIINSPNSNIAFYFFHYPVKYYGIILSLALVIGILLSCYLFKKNNSYNEYEKFYDSISYTVLISIIGARVFYILGDYNYYFNNPSEILMIHHGGISIFGAIFFGIMSIFIYSRINKNNCLKFLDYYSLVLPLCQAIGRFGNYFNQEAYGHPVNSFIKLYIDYNHRLNGYQDEKYFTPTFLYESFFDFLLFLFLFLFFKKSSKNNKYKNGTIFFLYIMLYSIIRFIIENYRIDSIMNIQSIPIAQIISFVLLVISCFGIYFLYKKS